MTALAWVTLGVGICFGIVIDWLCFSWAQRGRKRPKRPQPRAQSMRLTDFVPGEWPDRGL